MRFPAVNRRARAAGLATVLAASAVTAVHAQPPQVDYDLVPEAAAREAAAAARGAAAEPAAQTFPQVDYDLVSDRDIKPAEEAVAIKQAPTPEEPSDVTTATPEPAADAVPAASPPEVASQDDRALAQRVAARLESEGWGAVRESRDGNDAGDRQALQAYYSGADARPLFVNSAAGTLAPAGEALVTGLKSAGDWGLDADSFADALEIALGTAPADDKELALSLAALKYARHARGGRIMDPSEDLSSYLDRKPQLLPPEEVIAGLRAAQNVTAYLEDLHPPHQAFANLRTALLKMRTDQAEAEHVVQIPTSGPTLRLGSQHPDVGLLRARLDVAPAQDGQADSADPNVFDEALDAAVKAFQEDNGLAADGIVGPRTRSAFGGKARSISEAMLVANMEMWRWMPRDLGELHIFVNIPEYELRVVKSGRVVHAERIIVGKTDKQTPSFSDEMETIVFNPMWGVPNSIKVNELLPSLARGGSTFERQNLRLSYNGRTVDPRTVNWAQADIRNYHVFQPPGPGNVLGVVKFLFPNRHQVYMHDTPTKNLFNSSTRTYSHGCMRVRDPMRLAEILLEADRSWPANRVASMVGGTSENHVTLERHVPVHVVYQTAIADEDGNVRAVSDIYRHEERVRLALAGDWNSIPRHRNHLAPVQIDRGKIEAIARRSQQYQQNPVSDLFQAIFGGFN